MSAAPIHKPPDREPAPLGTPETWREYIAEMAWFAGRQCELIKTYTDIGDDAGLAYAARRLAAYTRQVIDVTRDLHADRKRREV